MRKIINVAGNLMFIETGMSRNNACIYNDMSVTYTTQHFQDNIHYTNNAQNIIMCNINLHLCYVWAPESVFLRCIVSTVACTYSNQGVTLYAITRASCS